MGFRSRGTAKRMTLFLLVRYLLRRIRCASCPLLSLLSEFFNGTFKMLTIVGEFPFCAFVAEEFDFAVCEFGSNCILKRRIGCSEIFSFRNKSDGNAFDTFGMTKVGR